MCLFFADVACLNHIILHLNKMFGLESDPGESVEDSLCELFKSNHAVD